VNVTRAAREGKKSVREAVNVRHPVVRNRIQNLVVRGGRADLQLFRSTVIPRALTWKAPTAQLTRIDAADQLFSVLLTCITSVPECAV
jgi:hypothetical protein